MEGLLRQVVREHLSRELAAVVALDAELLGAFDGPFGPFDVPSLDPDDDEALFGGLDLTGIGSLPPPFPQTLPPSLGPLQHPPGRKDRKRS